MRTSMIPMHTRLVEAHYFKGKQTIGYFAGHRAVGVLLKHNEESLDAECVASSGSAHARSALQ